MKMDAWIEGEYRYLLQRTWDETLPRLLIIMLNPSTADATKNDPTLLRCIHFAMLWGFGGIDVVNPFALRSPSPAVLKEHVDPVGPHCDEAIARALGRNDACLLAWGNPPEATVARVQMVEQTVLAVARALRLPVYVLGRTRYGHPKHPLARGAHRVPNDQKPIPYEDVVHP